MRGIRVSESPAAVNPLVEINPAHRVPLAAAAKVLILLSLPPPPSKKYALRFSQLRAALSHLS